MKLIATLLLTVLAAASPFRAKMDTWACRNKAFMEDFAEAAIDGDRKAMAMALLIARTDDGCVRIREGQRVNVTNAGWIDPVHEIRLEGHLGKFYVINGLFDFVGD